MRVAMIRMASGSQRVLPVVGLPVDELGWRPHWVKEVAQPALKEKPASESQAGGTVAPSQGKQFVGESEVRREQSVKLDRLTLKTLLRFARRPHP